MLLIRNLENPNLFCMNLFVNECCLDAYPLLMPLDWHWQSEVEHLSYPFAQVFHFVPPCGRYPAPSCPWPKAELHSGPGRADEAGRILRPQNLHVRRKWSQKQASPDRDWDEWGPLLASDC